MNRSRFLLYTLISLAAIAIITVVICLVKCNSGGTVPLDEPVIPTAGATAPATINPSASPSPTPSTEPVAAYRLPLVPIWDERTSSPAPTPSATLRPTVGFQPTLGQYSSSTKDFLAVGTENGVATAILLVRMTGTQLNVLAIPHEAMALVYTLDEECKITQTSYTSLGAATVLGGQKRNQQVWNLIWAVKNLVGVQVNQYVCIELECLDDVLASVGGFEGTNQTYTPENIHMFFDSERESKTYIMLDIGVGLVKCLKGISIWELPSIQKATKGHVSSSLSTAELISMARGFQSITAIECYTLPLVGEGEQWTLDSDESLKILRNLYG